jgi:DNA gyrase subunit A
MMSNIEQVDFAEVITDNMRAYGLEVNKGRAIPSIADSLKPVQRRVLFGLLELKGFPEKEHLGSAEVVGYVLGHTHPHGDSSVYEAIVRMAQPLIMLIPLIDFHGAVGSLVDPAAAQRYTGCRLSSYGLSIIKDCEIPGVIEYKKNYNDRYDEPVYFNGPMATLNLLINPQLGIGVGLASNFTCHAPQDVLQCLKYRMDNPNCTIDELLLAAPLQPSFPKCGKIVNPDNLPKIYKTGRGAVILQAKYKWEEDYLLIEELPYRVDAGEVKKKLSELIDNDDFPEISEIYEERGRLKIYCRPSNRNSFIRRLFKNTALQNQYNINMMATDLSGKPHLYTLLEILDTHIKLQHERLIKKASFYKEKYQKKKHIQEGLVKALDNIDKVIELIKSSRSVADAKLKLQTTLLIDDDQARAILEIKLSRLTHLEVDEVKADLALLIKQIKEQDEIITSPEKREIIYFQEVEEIQLPTFSRTEIVDLSSVDSNGIKPVKPFNLVSDKKEYEAQYEWGGDTSLVLDLLDEVVIVTTKMRGFVREGKDFIMGVQSWNLLLPLGKNEDILFVKKKKELATPFFFEIDNTWRLHSSFVGVLSSRRGRRIILKNYEAKKIKVCARSTLPNI